MPIQKKAASVRTSQVGISRPAGHGFCRWKRPEHARIPASSIFHKCAEVKQRSDRKPGSRNMGDARKGDRGTRAGRGSCPPEGSDRVLSRSPSWVTRADGSHKLVRLWRSWQSDCPPEERSLPPGLQIVGRGAARLMDGAELCANPVQPDEHHGQPKCPDQRQGIHRAASFLLLLIVPV